MRSEAPQRRTSIEASSGFARIEVRLRCALAMARRWSPRTSDSHRLLAVACLALVSSGLGRRQAAASSTPPAIVARGGAASAGGGDRGSPAGVVLASERMAEADAWAGEAALPVLRLAALGGGQRSDLVPFGPDGDVRPGPMRELALLLAPRSVRSATPGTEEEPQAIDPRLVALLIRISDELGRAPLTIVSGHREPGRGTSRKSFHVRGMAVDIAVAGKRPSEIREAALRAGAGGIGLYPAFVHVDVRDEPYRWGGGGRGARRRPAAR